MYTREKMMTRPKKPKVLYEPSAVFKRQEWDGPENRRAWQNRFRKSREPLYRILKDWVDDIERQFGKPEDMQLFRLRAGLNQSQLAKLLLTDGSKPDEICKMEMGERSIRRSHAMMIYALSVMLYTIDDVPNDRCEDAK
jgi:hypothetical protein